MNLSDDRAATRFARSLRFRLTLLFAAVTLATLGSLGVLLDYALAAQLAAREREELSGKLVLFRHVLAELPALSALEVERHRLLDIPVGHGDLQAGLLDAAARPLLDFPSFPWPPDLVEQAAKGTQSEGLTATQGRTYRLVLASSPVGESGDAVVVALGHDTTEANEIVARFRRTMLLAMLIGSLLAGTLGYLVAARGLRPLRGMVQAARRISAERLNERLDERNVPLELQDLAESFNAMLARLEQSFKRLSDFSSDLAHELRTPLSNLMLHAQVALDRPRNEAELRHVLESSLEQLDRLSRMANDMLFLAKADHATLRLRRETFSLEEEAGKVIEFFEPLAQERGVSLNLQGSATATADRAMIRRVLANLLSNAVRHARHGSAVELSVRTSATSAIFEVANAGPELSQSDLDRIFDRFYRAESSRSEPTEGAGLGLAIVKSIVELHRGEVAASSGKGKTIFRVVLPVREVTKL